MYQGREMEGGGQFFRPSTVTSVSPWISTASSSLHMGSVGDFRELKGLEAWKHMYSHLSRLLCHWSLIPYFPVNSSYMDSLPYSDIQSLSWPGLNLLPACVYNFFPTFLTYQPDYLTVYTPKMVLFKLQSLATISGSSIRLGALQVAVRSLRCVWLCDPMDCSMPGKGRLPCPSLAPRVCSDSCPLRQWCHLTISSCRPLLLLPSIFPSIRVFSNELALHIRWPKYWSFSFSMSPSNEYSGLISFRID